MVCSGNTVIHTYALLDSGSDRTFCEQRLAQELNLANSPIKLVVQTMSPGSPHVLNTAVVSLDVSSLEGNFSINLSEVVVVGSIPVAPPCVPSSVSIQKHPHLHGVSLPEIDGGSVTLLIGNDYAAAHRCLDSRFSPEPRMSPDAVLTPFGWMLRGMKLKHSVSSSRPVSNLLVRGLVWPSDTQDIHDLLLTDEGETFSLKSDPDLYDKEGLMKLLRDHHEMLEFGLKYAMEDPIAYDMMVRNLSYVDGHYQLPLLWRNAAEKFPESKHMAWNRLTGLKKRFLHDQSLKEKYSAKMQNMIDSGYAEIVPNEEVNSQHRTWYILHHPVFSAKKPGKIRIVYDCAAAAGNRSLNDFLMKGPDLTNSLISVLLRFRRWLVPIIADVEAMFYQVRVSPPDRDALRFYWWTEGNLDSDPDVYRMMVHLFGAKSSPHGRF